MPRIKLKARVAIPTLAVSYETSKIDHNDFLLEDQYNCSVAWKMNEDHRGSGLGAALRSHEMWHKFSYHDSSDVHIVKNSDLA